MEAIHKPTLHAPELDGGLAWFNTRRPLSMKELRGCVVLLDFWTYCCINCMHVLPVLRALEERFEGRPVVVIGVHSGKFLAEQDPARIREAIGRYDVSHPVVVDDRMMLWSRFGVRSWPTLVVVRPDGTIAAIAPGEPTLDTLIAFVEREMKAAEEKGLLASGPPACLEPDRDEHDPLRYPGEIVALDDGRIVVSDSGHNRVLVLASDGRMLHTIGSGLKGLLDGPIAEAAFDDPQGIAPFGDALYVADARNHALRKIDLARGEVTTVAGNGELGLIAPSGRVDARGLALRSPWGLHTVGDAIYVAMAGNHQIWRYFPGDETIEVYAGSGVEALIDGPVARSAWAQPSGLCVSSGRLFVADSETSALRAIDLAKGDVETIIGEGLFDFGDEEGAAEQTMLQHPLDVAALPDGALLVADTYNGKLKRVDLGGAGRRAEARVHTVLGGLNEPGAVAIAPDGSWLVADTNAHRVVRVTRGEAKPIDVRGAPKARTGSLAKGKPKPSSPSARGGGPEAGALDDWFTSLLEMPEGEGLGPGDASVRLSLVAPPGFELAEAAPIRAHAEVSRRSDLLELVRPTLSFETDGGATQIFELPVLVRSLEDDRIEAEIVVSVDYTACSSGDRAACFPRNARIRVPVRLLKVGGVARLAFDVPLAAMT